jgi:hypothetical protein
VNRARHGPIAITQAAFEALARTLPFGNVSFENKTDEEGQRPDLAGPFGGRQASLAAGRGRELQRRDSQAGRDGRLRGRIGSHFAPPRRRRLKRCACVNAEG